MQALGTMMSFTAFGLMGAGVMKAFQITNEIGELKEILRDIRRGLEENAPGGPRKLSREVPEERLRTLSETEYAAAIQAKALQSAAPLLRAINQESAVLKPEVVNSPSRNA